MRTAAERGSPPLDVDEGWRDLISSAPPPPPTPPREAVESQRATLPAGLHTDRQGCVTRVQFAAAAAAPEPPGFDAADRRLWMMAGGLMGLATVVLLLLGVLTFRPASDAQTQSASLPSLPAQIHAPSAPAIAVVAQPAVGSARPLLAQHALRHSKHARGKHKKIATR